jgi:hypothetical protein
MKFVVCDAEKDYAPETTIEEPTLAWWSIAREAIFEGFEEESLTHQHSSTLKRMDITKTFRL